MTNYSLLAQAKLLKMVEEYVALTVRGEKCESFTGGCLVQVTSTNPFEISDSSNHMRVKNPNRILEELKTVNSNINLPSMKGALIFLQKWNFECQYFPATDDLKFDIIIEDVKYMDGIGTAEIIMDTVFLEKDASLKKKFKRLKKYLVAQEFNTSHPIEKAITIIEDERFKISEMKRKADQRAQNSFHTTLNPMKDPFYVSDNEYYPTGKTSVSKSQISQNSEFELLSLNSATEARYGSVNIKPSVVKKPFNSLPGPDMFSLNLDLLSSQPLLQKIQIDDDDIEGKKSKAKTAKKDEDMSQSKHIEIMELEEISEEAYGAQSAQRHSQDIEDLEDRVSEDPAEDDEEQEEEEKEEEEEEEEEESKGNGASEEASEKENAVEEQQHRNRGQKLKRNFHEMIEQNKNTTLEFPQQDLKKGKYQWGLNHRNEQQEFRKQIEGRKSLVQIAPETDTLQLLASQFWNREQKPVEENKLIEEEEQEESRGINRSLGVNKVYNTTLHPYNGEDDDNSSDYSNSRGVEQRYNMDHKKKKAGNSTQQSVQRPMINRRVDVVETRQSSGSKSGEPERVYKQIKNPVVSSAGSGGRAKGPEIISSYGKGPSQAQKKIAMAQPAVVDSRKKSSVIEIERTTVNYRESTKRQTDEVIRNMIREREGMKKKQSTQEKREYTQYTRYREDDSDDDVQDARDREIAKKEKYLEFGREYKKIDSMATQMAKSAMQEEKARLMTYIDLTKEETIQKAKKASNKGLSYSVVQGEKRRHASPNDITNYTDMRKASLSKSAKNSRVERAEIIQEREFKRVENPLDPSRSINISDFKDIALKPKKVGGSGNGAKNLKQSSKHFFEII